MPGPSGRARGVHPSIGRGQPVKVYYQYGGLRTQRQAEPEGRNEEERVNERVREGREGTGWTFRGGEAGGSCTQGWLVGGWQMLRSGEGGGVGDGGEGGWGWGGGGYETGSAVGYIKHLMTYGTEPNVIFAYARGAEIHHPIISNLWYCGGWLERDRERMILIRQNYQNMGTMSKSSLFSRYKIIIDKDEHFEGCVHQLFKDVLSGPKSTFNCFIKLTKY